MPEAENIVVETEIVEKKTEDNITSINVFRELTEILEKENINFCIMRNTCLNVVLNRKFTDTNPNLYMSIYLSDKLKEILKQMNYIIETGKIIKNNITIYLLPMPSKTKKWTVGNKVMNVPYPLVKYLEQTFHKPWEKLINGK